MLWQKALQRTIDSWRGTPWVAGQQCRGRGVDCVRFVIAVLDELHQVTLPPVPRLPQDMSLHDREGAYRVAKAIESRYPHEIITPCADLIESGDVIVMRTGKASGPGHVLIAGADPRQLWHACAGVGVCRTAAPAGNVILRIWRPTRREEWR